MHTITLHYSPALVRRAVLAYLRRGFGTGGLIALAFLVAAALFLVVTAPGSWLAGAIFGAAAVLILLLVGLYLFHYRQGMAKLARMDQSQAVLELTETGLTATSRAGSFSTPWSNLTGLWRFADFWLLILGRGQFMTLPLADLTKEAQAFIAAHVGAQGQPPA